MRRTIMRAMDRTALNITNLIKLYAEAVGRSPSTVSRWLRLGGDFIPRMMRGGKITTHVAARVFQWFSDHWPADLDWPSDIPRPAPTPGSPASEEVA